MEKKHTVTVGGGDTAHTLLKGGTIGVETPHNMERSRYVDERLGGWLVDLVSDYSWLHLAS